MVGQMWLCFLEDNLELSAFPKYLEGSRTICLQFPPPPIVNLLHLGLHVVKSDGVNPEGNVDRK